MTKILSGISAVGGMAIGKVKTLNEDFKKGLAHYLPGTIAQEEEKFHSAYQNALEEMERTIKHAREKELKEQLTIMDAYRMIMLDPVLKAEVLKNIKKSVPGPLAVLKASEKMASLFSNLDDPYLKERAVDIENVGKRICRFLLGANKPDDYEDNGILCAADIDPSYIANIPEGKVSGLILGNGSVTSHAVILAKAKGIVTVAGLGEQVDLISDGMEVILDGGNGQVILNADESTFKEYRQKLDEERKWHDNLKNLAHIPAVTKDGHRVILAANISKPDEIDQAIQFGCEGVGLFRTEFLFMGRTSSPSEEEQFEAYKAVIGKCDGRLCVIRTMDIGGDKPVPYLENTQEENPFLGWRAIRICLERTDIFITQIKAVYRAACFGKAAIMLPMVTGLHEIHRAKELIEQALEELHHEGVKYSSTVPFGIMIETPAAAIMADILAKECDFFSIGTNDLVQYTLAVDRGNPRVSHLYKYSDPSVLRLIHTVILAAHGNHIPVGICGEMAGDPAAAAFLVSIGIDELSMSGPCIPKVKEMILNTVVRKDSAEYALSLDGAERVEEYMSRFESIKK